MISRHEFSDYLKWVFNHLNNIDKGNEVLELNYNGEHLQIKTANEANISTKNLVLGTGLTPYIPKSLRKNLSETLFHSSEFTFKKIDLRNKKVAIIGGGQSAAEIVEFILSDQHHLPAKIQWISTRDNFLPIDDSPFTNELFVPAYSRHFYSLSASKKETLLNRQRLASDGISESTTLSIYRHLYHLKYIKKMQQVCHLYPSNNLSSVEQKENQYIIHVHDLHADLIKKHLVDMVILCTGYQYNLPPFLKQISPKKNQRGLIVDKDYRLKWRGDHNCSIYIQNGARHTHGIADPNLSLLAYRSARIINHIAQKKIYKNIEGDSLIQWGTL